MARKRQEQPDMKDWISWAFKGLAGVLGSFCVIFVSQLNGNMVALNSTLKSMQDHQIEADKRITTIEVAREVTLPRYLAMESQVATLRIQMDQALGGVAAVQKTLDRNRIH